MNFGNKNLSFKKVPFLSAFFIFKQSIQLQMENILFRSVQKDRQGGSLYAPHATTWHHKPRAGNVRAKFATGKS